MATLPGATAGTALGTGIPGIGIRGISVVGTTRGIAPGTSEVGTIRGIALGISVVGTTRGITPGTEDGTIHGTVRITAADTASTAVGMDSLMVPVAAHQEWLVSTQLLLQSAGQVPVQAAAVPPG